MDHSQHTANTHIRRGRWIWIGFAAIAAYFLWTGHRAHVMGALPYLLVLACPLMHLFHHGHHHHHASDNASANRDADNSKDVS